jgi:hypothetical protein
MYFSKTIKFNTHCQLLFGDKRMPGIATEATAVFDVITSNHVFSPQTQGLILRTLNGERRGIMTPFRHRGVLDNYPHPVIINDEGDDEPIDSDVWESVKQEVITLDAELTQYNIPEDQIIRILVLLMCERLNCFANPGDVFNILIPPREFVFPKPKPEPIQFQVQTHDSEYDHDCPICLCEPSEQVFKCGSCKHEVCEECMKNWLNSHIAINGLQAGTEDMVFEEGFHDTCPHCRVVLITA